MVPHEDVFYRLFGFEKPKKAWKQKKIDMADFEKSIGEITNSVRSLVCSNILVEVLILS